MKFKERREWRTALDCEWRGPKFTTKLRRQESNDLRKRLKNDHLLQFYPDGLETIPVKNVRGVVLSLSASYASSISSQAPFLPRILRNNTSVLKARIINTHTHQLKRSPAAGSGATAVEASLDKSGSLARCVLSSSFST